MDSYIEYATLHVLKESVETYKKAVPWKNFKNIIAIDGTTPDTETHKCAKPSIRYEDGQIKFACSTEGVTFITDITDSDIRKHYDAIISLSATYTINVYATKSNYDDSDIATATLCWIDEEPKTEGITNGVASVRANAILIQNNGSVLNITGAPEGSNIKIYDLSGHMVGSTMTTTDITNVNTTLRNGDVGIVKIGEKTIKVVMK